MNKMNLLMMGAAAVVLSGCFAAPQMRMAAPEDSESYNGIAVKLHSINDGDFGNATVRAVMEFQQDHKIIASGIVDEATLMAIEEAQDAVGYTVTIRGLNAAQVAELQEQYVDCEVIKTEG